MLGLLRKQVLPIGIDVCDDRVNIAQLASNSKGLTLLGGTSRQRPNDVTPGSSKWQRWVLEVVSNESNNSCFKGKEVVASVPPRELFIDHLKMPKVSKGKVEEELLNRIRQRLSFPAENSVMKYIPTEEQNVLVMVMDRDKIDRHLAVYEKAGVQIRSIDVWPLTLVKTYVEFFGRRKSDREATVLILDFTPSYCNVLISKHINPLFARSIPLGTNDLQGEEAIKRFVMEVNACRRHFESIYKKPIVDRAIFLTSDSAAVQAQIAFTAIARQMEIPAQMGNCLAAIELDSSSASIERRDCNFSWASAFGLSLSSLN